MARDNHIGTPLRLLALFVLLSAIPLTALGWLSWKTLRQERELEARHQQERLDKSAAALASELEHSLADWHSLLQSALSNEKLAEPPSGTALLLIDSNGVVKHRGASLPYVPAVSEAAGVRSDTFAAAEELEYGGDLDKAADAYRHLAASDDRRIHASALMRLARVSREKQKIPEALLAYSQLALAGEVPADDDPAELVARGERIRLLNSIGNKKEAGDEAALLSAALRDGSFLIDKHTFELYSEFVPKASVSAASLESAEALAELWPTLRDEPEGQSIWRRGATSTLIVWRRTPGNGHVAALLGAADLATASAAALARDLQVRMVLEDLKGAPQLPDQSSHSADSARSIETIRSFRETGLPWNLHIVNADGRSLEEYDISRRNLTFSALILVVLVIAAAGYFVFRSVSRELGVARLQSDFVATVSHEFRTPLTAMRHLTDMLEEGVVPAERLARYYHALGKETRRLHEMVENLLDFGRMEAGHRVYQMEKTNASELAANVVEDFREGGAFTPQRLEWTPPVTGSEEANGGMRILGDREALTLALRNLIDNAIKYSPESSTVHVSVKSARGLARISVKDHGDGISKAEQRRIFMKFVRGSTAHELNVKGTGLGLAMVTQIVRAHGGRLELDSEQGHGSRFTILLPIEAETAHE